MPNQEEFKYRKATIIDCDQLEDLIKISAEKINNQFYSDRVIASAIGTIWTVDKQLITDKTYWIVENNNKQVIACGGWSKRKLLFGKQEENIEISELIPGIDSARIRAFFVHPNYVRQGIGKKLLELCEKEAIISGYTSLELVATLSGEKLYESKGFKVLKRYMVETEKGIFNNVVSMFKLLD